MLTTASVTMGARAELSIARLARTPQIVERRQVGRLADGQTT